MMEWEAKERLEERRRTRFIQYREDLSDSERLSRISCQGR